MAAAVLIAEYLLNDASTGSDDVESNVVDNTGNGNSAIFDGDGGADAVWFNDSEGTGIDFTAAPNTSGSGIVRLTDIATNGNIGSSLDGANQVWLVIKLDQIAGHSNGMRLAAVGTSSGNTDFSLIKEANDDWYIRWDQESGGDNFQAKFVFALTTGESDVVIVQMDTTEALADDGMRLYLNGVEEGVSGGSNAGYVQDSTLDGVNNTNRYFTVGNRASRNRNTQGKIKYVAIGTGVLTSEQRTSIVSALAANDDETPFGGGGSTVNAQLESISLSTYPAAVQSDVDVAVAGGLESIALAASSALIQSDIDYVVAAVLESISVAGYPAVVQSDVDSVVVAGLAPVSLTAYQALVQADVDEAVAAALESIRLTANTAVISTGFNTQVNAQLEAISLGGLLASITADTAVSAGVAAVVVSANAAGITLGSALSAGVESIVLQPGAASVSISADISSALESIILTELNAEVSLSVAVDSAVESLTVTALGSVVTLSSGVSASIESLTLSAFNAVVTVPVSAVTAVGLEYTIESSLAHYSLAVNKLHFTFRR